MWNKIKKLIRDSNPLNKKVTFVEMCLSGKCYKIKDNLEIILKTFTSDDELKSELGLTEEEYDVFINSDNFYEEFKRILINRCCEKR